MASDDLDLEPSNQNEPGALSVEDAADAFLKTLETDDPGKGPSAESEEEQAPDDGGTPSGEHEEGSDLDESDQAALDTEAEGPSDGEGGDEEQPVDLNALVEFKANGSVVRVPVKDLTRLHGMESALTQRSQDLIRSQREIDEFRARDVAVLDVLVNRAKEKASKYERMDFLRLARELPENEYNNLRREAEEAQTDLQFLTTQAEELFGRAQEQRRVFMKAQAERALPMIKAAIPEWDNGYYDKLRSWAVENGAVSQVIDELVDPFAWTVIHKAYQYDNSRRIGTKKRAASPKKVLKTTERRPHKPVDDQRRAKAMDQLRESMTADAAADAFFARITEERAEG